MDSPTTTFAGNRKANPFATLRQFASARNIGQPVPAQPEQCELCSVGLAPEHRHLLELATHKIICSCDGCALRFQDVVGGRFKLIPRDSRSLPAFHLTDAEWEALTLPINMAFFFYHSPANKMIALYPGPAGATESLLPLTAWKSLVAANPQLADMEADVEALLINRVGDRRLYFLVPIDVCFELVGLIRMHWRGLSGGEEVWREIDGFFKRLEERSRPCVVKEAAHA